MQHQPRRPAGTPVGGQFASTYRPEATGIELTDDDFFELVDDPPSQLDSRPNERGDALLDPDEVEPSPEPLPPEPGHSTSGEEPAGPAPEGSGPDPLLARAFGVDPLVLEDARRLVAAARAEVESRRIDPETWSAAEAAITAAGRHLAAVIDLAVCRRHPRGFLDDLDYRDEIAASREATLEVLGALRPLGLPAGEQLMVVDSQRPAAALLNEVSGCFPSEWLDGSQEKDPPLRARVSPHRAHYSPFRSYWVDEGTQMREVRHTVYDRRSVPDDVEPEETTPGYWTWTKLEPRRVRGRRRSADLTVPSPRTRPHEARATATHELTHRLEDANRQLGHLEDAFIRRRCRDEDGAVRPARPIPGMRSERARDGGFVSPYVGKQYPTMTFHEVLSTGTEAVFTGSYGGLVGRSGERMDPDHRAFVLGCLAVA